MPYEVRTFSNPSAFLETAQAWLEQRELENSLLLGLALRLRNDPQYYPSTPCMKIVCDQDEPAVFALMTPPHNLILSGDSPVPERALDCLIEDLRSSPWSVPGVLAQPALAEQFREIWGDKPASRNPPQLRIRLYALRQVIPPLPSLGSMRSANAEDLQTLRDWLIAFQSEAMGALISPNAAEAMAFRRITDGEIFFWEHQKPVSMAASTRPTSHTISIGSVYTPPEQRRKGFASALVATLSQKLLDDGFECITLFTDLAYPTSNHIYQQVGYQAVCDFAEYRFLV